MSQSKLIQMQPSQITRKVVQQARVVLMMPKPKLAVQLREVA